MPEYLAPGVYVEEVDTGAKPIEGVSTSTAGMVGVTERGPADVPVLVTSAGEFARWYGGLLRDDDFGAHRFLPHAVEGFFTNGGKRLFVVRTVDPAATRAVGSLYDRGDATSISSTLLRAAGEGTGSGASPPPIVILPVNGLAGGDDVRIGDGSRAEYRTASAAPVAETVMVPVDLPLARSHGDPETVEQFARAVAEGYTVEADNDMAPGDTSVVVRGVHADIATLLADTTSGPGVVVLELGGAGVAEYRVSRQVSQVTVVDATDSTARVRIDAPVTAAYPAGSVISRVDLSGAVVQAAAVESAAAGEAMVWVDDRQGNLDTRADLVVIGNGEQREVRRIGTLGELTGLPAPVDGLEAGSRVERVTFPDRTLAVAAPVNTTSIELGAGQTAGLVAGQGLTLDPGGAAEEVTIVTVRADGATLDISPLGAAVAINKTVVPVPKEATAEAAAGSRVLILDNRLGVQEGTFLRLGTTPNAQVVSVQSVPGSTGISPDAGSVVVYPALADTLTAATLVVPLTDPVRDTAAPAMTLVLPAAAGADTLVVSDAVGLTSGSEVQITSPGGDLSFTTLTQNGAAVVPEMLSVTNALARAHPVGAGMVTRDPLITVQALDAGAWGNRLRVSVTDDAVGLVASTTLAAVVDPTTLRLGSRSGVEPGTVLEIRTPDNQDAIGDPVKVRSVDRTAGNILLAPPGLSVPQRVVGNRVRSREFSIEVLLRRQPDPATPSRDAQVIGSERFQSLSMDPRHSRYVEKVIGAAVGPLRKWDRRTEGASLYVRVTDLAASAAAAEQVRLGPEALVDQLPDGRWVPARHRLEEIVGDDAISLLTGASYVGSDNADPELRTGLQALRNVEDISLVAVPGQFGAQVQQGVIDHCELMRYRFAVLDARNEPADTIADVQDQRQQFDTRYAALYYPWLSVPDPFPDNPAEIRDYALPPSGHLLGIYARTDIERGVHKAPANEVVRGITGLRRTINKEQHDLLNPSPVNVNVIRDFRENNRGIRVYGGRVITSDPDWKYVNVRRLLIFIEASIDRGLQWVVFEPNSEALWARVRRTITNFLTVVWRNGALEGTRPEEAFFVRCDRTTMTQADLDNGRLIIQVGVAPVKPAEFVIVRIGLWTARADN